MFAILGGGFGLYGYLPAVARVCSEDILLPSRYRPAVERRAELERYSSRIDWVPTDQDAIHGADSVILARRPEDQAALVDEVLNSPQVERIFLEKPVAVDPAESSRVLEKLSASSKSFRIAYTFQYLPWAPLFFQRVADGNDHTLEIDWRFEAHHVTNNMRTWKRHREAGGGALRFYGIHLVALLSGAGYDTVNASAVRAVGGDEAVAWNAVFSGAGLPSCEVSVDCASQSTRFRVDGVIDAATPFSSSRDESLGHGEDSRISELVQLLRSISEQDEQHKRRYDAVNQLWMNIESLGD